MSRLLLVVLALVLTGAVPAAAQELTVAVAGLGALASLGPGRDNGHHSKPSVAWKHVDVIQPTFFQDPGGFSSFSRAADPDRLYITLV